MTNAMVAAVLMKMMATVNAGDAKGYASLYAPHAVIHMIGSGDLRGRDAIEQHEVELLREFPGTRLAFYSAWRQGPVTAVHYGVRGKTPAGQSMGHEGLLFFTFNESGLIEEERRYLDAMTPMAQLGAFGLTVRRGLPTLPDRMDLSDAVANPAALAAARRILHASDTQDTRAFRAGLRDDVVIDEMVLGDPFTGLDGAERWLETWARAAPDATTAITNIFSVGDVVLVEAVLRGTLKGPFGPVGAANVPFAVHRAWVMQLAGASLVRASAFMNAKELAEATGQWPPRPK